MYEGSEGPTIIDVKTLQYIHAHNDYKIGNTSKSPRNKKTVITKYLHLIIYSINYIFDLLSLSLSCPWENSDLDT